MFQGTEATAPNTIIPSTVSLPRQWHAGLGFSPSVGRAHALQTDYLWLKVSQVESGWKDGGPDSRSPFPLTDKAGDPGWFLRIVEARGVSSRRSLFLNLPHFSGMHTDCLELSHEGIYTLREASPHILTKRKFLHGMGVLSCIKELCPPSPPL